MNTTNSNIRQKAWSLYKANWKPLAVVLLFAATLSAIISIALTYAGLSYAARNIALFVFNVLIYPIETVGVSYVFITTWRGHAPTFKDTFYFCTSAKLWQSSIFLGAAHQLIIRALALPSNIDGPFFEGTVISYMLPFVSIIFTIVLIWMSVRLALAPYLMATDKEIKPLSAISLSFKLMNGKVWAFIRMIVAVMWWLPIVAVVLALPIRALPPEMLITMRTLWMPLATMILTHAVLLVSSILMPYATLSLAGFADGVITSVQE